MTDTIFALATARGKAGIAVVRVSGPTALLACEAFGVAGPLVPRRATLRDLIVDGAILDTCIVIYFAEESSFTGEKVVEFQIHGSESVVSVLLKHLAKIPGLRSAQAGEFTRRALENGVMDLTQVEGLADLIDAETEAQRRQAQRVMSGAIGARAEDWKSDLVRAAALIELTIDFVDEDIPLDVTPEVKEIVERLLSSFESEVRGSQINERVRAGFEIAIIGAPNVGKSSLLNALAGRDAAITSPFAGTTRDVIEVRLDIAGLPVTLLDMAGIRDTDDEIEKLGVSRALARAETADLRLFLVEPGEMFFSHQERRGDVIVWTKADIVPGPRSISSLTGEGLDWLIDEIRMELDTRISGSGILIRERHRNAVLQAIESMESAKQWLYHTPPSLELVAADLRAASHALDLLVGRIGVENLLDEIFSRFCIGK